MHQELDHMMNHFSANPLVIDAAGKITTTHAAINNILNYSSEAAKIGNIPAIVTNVVGCANHWWC